MAKVTWEQSSRMKQIIANVAAESFLRNGYTKTTVRNICKKADIGTGTFTGYYKTKDEVLSELMDLLLTQQFSVAEKLSADKADDKIYLYVTETVLQLHIVEMNEKLREVYYAAYSLKKSSSLIQSFVAEKVGGIFKEQLPQLASKDFYMLEVAASGIMRGYMLVPCTAWFSIDEKVESFLKSILRIYYVPDEKTQEIISYVKYIDFRRIAEETIGNVFQYLERQREELMIK